MKKFSILPKKRFRYQDIHISVFLSSPLFPLSAIALEIDPRKILKFVASSAV